MSTKYKIEEGKLVKTDEFFHPRDNILDGITFEDLIDTVFHNEKEVNEKVVGKVFEEILKQRTIDARHEVKTNMKKIISAIEKAKK